MMPPDDTPTLGLEAGLWLTISDIAEKKGKSRQAISKRVKSLVEDGKLETRDGPNGTKLVNLAAYDDAVGDVGDPAKEQAAETAQEFNAPDAPLESNRFRDAAAREKEYNADIKFLELGRQLKTLVPVADVDAAATKIAETMVPIIDRLAMEADRVHIASTKDGTAGVRAALKQIAREQRLALADALTSLGATAVNPTIDTDHAPAMETTDEP